MTGFAAWSFPWLPVLDLYGSKVTDDGIQAIPPLSYLESLNLSHGPPSVGNAGVAHLTRFPRLVSLDLSDTPVIGPGL